MNNPETQLRLKLLNKMNKLFLRLGVEPMDAVPAMILGIIQAALDCKLSKEDMRVLFAEALKIYDERSKSN